MHLRGTQSKGLMDVLKQAGDRSEGGTVVDTLEGVCGVVVLPCTYHDLADLLAIEDVLAGGVVDKAEDIIVGVWVVPVVLIAIVPVEGGNLAVSSFSSVADCCLLPPQDTKVRAKARTATMV